MCDSTRVAAYSDGWEIDARESVPGRREGKERVALDLRLEMV